MELSLATRTILPYTQLLKEINSILYLEKYISIFNCTIMKTMKNAFKCTSQINIHWVQNTYTLNITTSKQYPSKYLNHRENRYRTPIGRHNNETFD